MSCPTCKSDDPKRYNVARCACPPEKKWKASDHHDQKCFCRDSWHTDPKLDPRAESGPHLGIDRTDEWEERQDAARQGSVPMVGPKAEPLRPDGVSGSFGPSAPTPRLTCIACGKEFHGFSESGKCFDCLHATPEPSALSAESVTPGGYLAKLYDQALKQIAELRRRLQDTERERDLAESKHRVKDMIASKLCDQLTEMTKRAEIAESMARDADQALTAAQAELRTMLLQLRRYRAHHELLMKMQDNGTGCICDLCKQTDQLLRTQGGESSDTLPPKEK